MKKNKLKLFLVVIIFILAAVGMILYLYQHHMLKLETFFKPAQEIAEADDVVSEVNTEGEDLSVDPTAKIEQISSVSAQSDLKAGSLEEMIRKHCLSIQSLKVAVQIKEALYQDKNYDQLLKKLLDSPNSSPFRGVVDSLIGISTISHPGFHRLFEDFKSVSKALLIEAKINAEESFYKKLMLRLLYKVVFFKKVAGEVPPLESKLQKINEALQNRDLLAVGTVLTMIKSEEVKYSVWREHFKILFNELSLVNELIASLSQDNSCEVLK